MKKITIILSSFFLYSGIIYANSPKTKWYRYNKNGTPHITKTLTSEMSTIGYEELDANLRLIRTVKPYDAKAAKKAKEEKQALEQQQAEVDTKRNQLFKRYDSSARAMRKRTALINNLNSKRVFNEQQVLQAEMELQTVLEKAAKVEKAGKTIGDDLKKAIANKKNALKIAQDTLKDLATSQYKELQKLTTAIRKMRKYENEKP